MNRWMTGLIVVFAALPVLAARPTPTLTPDAEGYCQRTEFVAWSKDGREAAYSESYCKQPPPDAAYDTLYQVGRQGQLRRWLIGAEAGAAMKLDTRAKLIYGDSHRKAGSKSPDGSLEARARVDGEYLVVTFVSAKKGVKAPPPFSKELKLPYAKWPEASAPRATEIFWSPDSGALAVTVKGRKKEPGGGTLEVGTLVFHEIAPLAAGK